MSSIGEQETPVPPVSVGLAGQTTVRIASIDILRGLTMAVMIFVNELSSVRGLPWWTYHAPGNVDRMTYVDMVFPFFLFIVGLAMPLAVRQRIKRNASEPALWGHVVLRAFSLVVLGLILANADEASRQHMPLSGAAWAVIALVGAALYLNVYPESGRWKVLFRVLRVAGLVTLVGMLVLFRRVMREGGVGWLDPVYPEILGLIGFTYFAVSLLYLPTRRWLWMQPLWLVGMTVFCSLRFAKHFHGLEHTPLWYWPFENGSMPMLCLAGIVCSTIYLGQQRWPRAGQKMLLASGFGIVMLAAAWALAPLGISKIRGTPTWALASAGAATLLFTLLYWVCDVRKQTRWAAFVRPAGANTLLTYLLPDLFVYASIALGFTWLETHYRYGLPGIVKTVVFTAVMLFLSAMLTRARLRLQL